MLATESAIKFEMLALQTCVKGCANIPHLNNTCTTSHFLKKICFNSYNRDNQMRLKGG